MNYCELEPFDLNIINVLDRYVVTHSPDMKHLDP